MTRFACGLLLATTSLVTSASGADTSERLPVLFLGDDGHHRPAERFVQLQPVLAKRGIDVTYTDKVDDLNAETLGKYDCLIVYANIGRISPEQEKALLDFVSSGKGFVPIHCASYCFLNSEKYVELVGAQFQRHGTGTFREQVIKPDHPLMANFDGFESWDETYVHHKHNDKDRVVLSYRVDQEGREPWTWIRTHDKGRVFYTAWGHDARTWSNPGFHNLIERGIRWTVGGDPSLAGAFVDPDYFQVPEMTPKRTDVKPFEYVDATGKIPYYPPGEKWGTLGEPISKMQLPLPAEESMKHIVTPVGFKVELFAADPDIKKPICMAWDERGRLWCGETIDYPNELKPPGEGRDRIKICEDTDGDGRADKFTVFSEKLSIPTSITFHRGGVIVQDGMQTLYLKDTDGDDRADERRVLFSGWNMGDTHGGVSNFQYGLDNWIWAMQGYNNSEPMVAGKKHHAFRMGFFRFKPDGSELEFVRSTNNNTWGLGISEEGIIFGSTANRNPSVYMPIANRFYEQVRGWSASQLGTIADTHLFQPITDKVRQVDQHGGYTAGAGHALYTARTYPKQYWNRTAFVCGPTGKLVGTFVLKRDGADFRSTSPCNLIASDDEWSAPIMAEVGPDGNVWVLDWYNYIVQHNPTPQGFNTGKGNAYESDLRDKRHGRIYRVVYESAKVREPISLADASPETLVNTLKSDNLLWRKHAQRLLVERGKLDVLPTLMELARDEAVDEIGLNTAVIHALWTMHGLGALDGNHPEATKVAYAATCHKSGGVRRNAALVLPRNDESIVTILQHGLLVADDKQVVLATLLSLADMPTDQLAGEALAQLITVPSDLNERWIADAVTSAAATHALPFLREVASSHSVISPRALEIVSIVSEHFARGVPSAEIDSLLVNLKDASPRSVSAILNGLERGWPKDRPVELKEETQSELVELLSQLPIESKVHLLKFASTVKSERFEQAINEIVTGLTKTIESEREPDDHRMQAARQMVEFRAADPEVAKTILATISPRSSPELTKGLLDAVAQSEAEAVGALLVDIFPSLTPAAREVGRQILLRRPAWTAALLDGVEARKISLNDLTLDQKQSLAAHPQKKITQRAKTLLASAGALANPDRQKVLEELMPLTEQTGDVGAGKEIFKKQCTKCHTHRGEGQKIGPDLTGMAVHPKAELLMHLIDPSRSVEGNYRVYSVVTVDGRVISGLLASETKTSLELFDVDGKKHALLREDIEELVASPKSLMPEGFEKQVKADDIVNLLEFLTARGKFLPIPLEKYATIVSTQGMFNSKDAGVERLIFPDWSPKEFQGVSFQLVDPHGDNKANVIMLNGTNGKFPPLMPKLVTLPCNAPAKAIHFLSGVSGWGFPAYQEKSVSMIVRLKYADGSTEDHNLTNGIHFADYIRRVDVPESKFAFSLRGQQVRYLAVYPKRKDTIKYIDLVKGPDPTSPVVMAVTIEAP